MENHVPSIFNDVVGPVMRGPSSSHSAAALRIGRMCRDLMGGDPGRVKVQYDRSDALATTHRSQGSDMGIMGGLMGFESYDQRLLNPEEYLDQSGIKLDFEVTDTGIKLPNLYVIELQNHRGRIHVAAISTGGGMIKLIELDGCPVSMEGDYHETLIYSRNMDFLIALKDELNWADQVIIHNKTEPFIEIKSTRLPDPQWKKEIRSNRAVYSIRSIFPVLPVLSGSQNQVPFTNLEQMFQFNKERLLKAWELAAKYESIRGGIPETEVWQKMNDLYIVMRNAIETGLKGTRYRDRIFGAQSVDYKKKLEQGILSNDVALHKITMYVSAIMEVKSSMGVIVAAPTAGSCGTFPGAVLGVADSLDVGTEEILHALLAGSLVGLFIATASTFSAEIGGCQAECGSAGGMAAASIVSLLGGTLEQCMSAASIALQNSLGMICDPIAARVEAPCLGKNISAAANALTSANMAMAGYNHLIPLDEVIATMDRVGKSLPRELRCTALGGLAITPSASEVEKQLKQ